MSALEPARYPRLLDWLRYLCAFLLYMYGTSKLAHLQFNLHDDIARLPVGSLTGYQLTWYYYGLSRSYASILGLTQVLGATLLLFRRTALAGSAIMLPVMTNILLVNIFILRNDYGPYLISALISASLLTILWSARNGLLQLFWAAQPSEPEALCRLHLYIRCAIILFVISIMVAGTYLMEHAKKT